MLKRAMVLGVAMLVVLPAVSACEGTALPARLAGGYAPATKSIAWQQCEGGVGAVQCGTVTVPMDWSRPDGPKIKIAVARRAATQPSKRIGTLVYLPGGPGESGVDAITGEAEFAGLEKRFDLVSLDPRGVGKSSPLTCPSGQIVSAIPTSLPRTDQDLADLRERNRALAAACRKATGPVFEHLDSASAARDLNAIRTALGEQALNLYGHSYGTILGQEYAKLFGRHVRAAVLDGTMDHSASRHRFAVTAAQAFDRSFSEFARWCQSNTSCALHGSYPADVLQRVLAKAQRGELAGTDGSGNKWTPFTVTLQIDAMLWTPSWTPAAMLLNTLDSGKEWPSEPPGELPATLNYADPILCQDFAMRYPSGAALRLDLASAALAAPRVGFSATS